MANRIDLSNILINFLKKARYERHIEEGTLEENQFYAVTDGNEKTEYGDLFGNIENQTDLYNALYASRLFKMEMCNDVRGYDIVHKLYDRREFDLSKFTVVGNPTISEDGIASGSAKNNYLTLNLNYPSSDIWEIKQEFNISESATEKYIGLISRGSPGFQIFNKRGDKNLTFEIGGTTALSSFYGITYGANYQITVESLGGGNYQWTLFDLDNGNSMIKTFSGAQVYLDGTFRIGLTQSGNWGFTGSIDLKNFSITVDGTEVFNGLKDLTQYDTYTLPSSEVITIPYIPSVDGVKIVDVAYKPLVDQLYAETGMGNYIIIDETNKTFRLPLPDIYSQIEKKTSFTLRKWED